MSGKRWLFAIALNGVYLKVLSEFLFLNGTPDKNDLLIEILVGFLVCFFTFGVPVIIVLCVFFTPDEKKWVPWNIQKWLIASTIYLLSLWPILAKLKDAAINNPGPVVIEDFLAYGTFGVFVIWLCYLEGGVPRDSGSDGWGEKRPRISTWYNDSTGESGTIEHWD